MDSKPLFNKDTFIDLAKTNQSQFLTINVDYARLLEFTIEFMEQTRDLNPKQFERIFEYTEKHFADKLEKMKKKENKSENIIQTL